ncbi:cysteine-rich receptor-like protein kinase [Tanacetum coccineum]
MTINKAQGQSLKKIGIYLPDAVFGHGQLYVALSRETTPDGLKVLVNFRVNKSPTKNIVYKDFLSQVDNQQVISKLLASRLAKVIDTIIGPNQSSFIKGRQILDGCLIVNEIIRMASLEKHKLLTLLSVDFEKAFDSVNWGFILDIMRQMGFGFKWRKWISSCLSSASISVLINGSPSKEFKMELALRQGEPLSPLLFLFVASPSRDSLEALPKRGLY